MAIRIRIGIDAPDDVLGLFGAGAKVRLERSATGGGAGFSEVATATIVSGTTIYVLDHAGGTAGDWYRHRYSTTTPTLPEHYGAYSDEYQGGVESGLCTLADVKQRLGITDATDDELLLELIDQVTDEIIAYTGRQLVPDPATGTKTVYLDYDGDGATLWLPRGVRSVSYLGVATGDQPDDGTGTYTEITATYRYVDPPEHERSRGWPGTRITLRDTAPATFYAGKRTVKLTGAFGWAAVPPTIERIAQNVVVRRYIARQSGRGGADIVVGSPDTAFTTLRDVSPEERRTLDGYRDWGVA